MRWTGRAGDRSILAWACCVIGVWALGHVVPPDARARKGGYFRPAAVRGLDDAPDAEERLQRLLAARGVVGLDQLMRQLAGEHALQQSLEGRPLQPRLQTVAQHVEVLLRDGGERAAEQAGRARMSRRWPGNVAGS